jgi:ADP-L-glycero-D-manno-heptose 6-epimerase
MKYFITGGKGFVGLNLVEELKNNPKNEVLVYNKDLRQKIKIKNDFDVIYHLAANTDTRYPDDVDMYRNNIDGFLNILDFALSGKSKLIYASSAAMYGNYKKTAYANSKQLVDEIAKFFFNRLPIVGLKFFNVYGPKEKQKGRMASMVTNWALQIKAGKRPVVFKEERESRRDFVYVKDIVKALLTAQKTKNGIYDAGTGKPRTFDDVLLNVQINLGTNKKPIYISNPFKDRYQRFTKATLGWGFKPDYTLEEGIKDYLSKNSL